MSYCDGCNEEREDVEYLTQFIHYSLGPVMAGLCKTCRDGEVIPDPPIPVMALIREM